MSEPTDIDNDDDEAFAEATLTQAIENQIESGDPAAAKATFNKLTLVGYEREDILNLMAHVLAFEIDNMLVEDREFDRQWYENALRALPELPPEMDQGEDE
ncbi:MULTISPECIES: hypothetical protein [Pseudomonas]|uniref:Uncharacterized protein n=1 Tax=Pseudomonas asiatica TaxID=2219225 RepID=A0A9X4HXC5_9PSED|nr:MULTISPECIES: hypothetical protein [Pseudomonas]MEE1904677.1 hypothetical protein [Pseudomonas inefficax]AHD12313.1 hypothetical protein C163_00775 [Pseudomonas sp. FGI182]MDD2109374.1 hypothetical protein [Pseudomonas asiatica]MEE1907817.1 hypothetical protein [Pseudomonas inefficax]MEE1987489.1 hypothetical protein [Pseudomonas inefficax]